jgi:predicted RNA-binding Zn-ribbon protein involved in translation (DUF1610 family)
MKPIEEFVPINGGILHWRFRCPFCGSVQIKKYTRFKKGYRCEKCGNEFMERIDLLNR